MFCGEPIVKVYTGQSDIFIPETETYDNIGDSFLDCYHDITYHVEPGQCLVLETENYAIFIDSDGVHLLNAPASPRSDREWLDPCTFKERSGGMWVDFQQTLFEGEILSDVQMKDGIYFAEFTDFTLKIIPYEVGKMNEWFPRKDYRSYLPVLGFNRYLKRTCVECGGNGELLLDFVCNYVVRCKSCKQSTWAGMCLIDAIEDWNAGELHCDLSNISIE